MITLFEAIKKIQPNGCFVYEEENISTLRWDSIDIERPTDEEILAKIAELEAAEPMRLLRIQRNQLLAQSDWMALSDRTMTQAQIDYRQALRDLPETANPQLDENGQLTNVTWPTEPGA